MVREKELGRTQVINALKGHSAKIFYTVSSLVALLEANWGLLALMLLGLYFRREVGVTMKYLLCIIAIAVFEPEKRRKISLQTKYYIIVLRVLMAKDLGEEATWVEDFIAEESL